MLKSEYHCHKDKTAAERTTQVNCSDIFKTPTLQTTKQIVKSSILKRSSTHLLPTRTTRLGSESRAGFSQSASWVMRCRLNASLLIRASWWSRVPHNDSAISGTAPAPLQRQTARGHLIHNWLLRDTPCLETVRQRHRHCTADLVQAVS